VKRLLLCALLALAGGLAAETRPLDQYGRGHAWRGATGQLTVVDFAASWCAPCRRTLPRLEAFAREHPAVRVLVVSVDERRQGRDELVASLHLTLPVIWDEDHAIARHYQPPAMPTTYVLSPQGEILHTSEGSGRKEWEDLVRVVEQALGRRAL
jgi:thiol-disulfide isomerase/thioredoxin